MAKPMIKNIPAFDANVGYGIESHKEIVYSGVAKYNKLYVYEADTNALVIDAYESQGTRFVIPTMLQNSKSYYCCVSVVNIDDKETELSDYVFFTCYTTPSLFFNNVNDGDVVYTTMLDASLTYIQQEGRELLSYMFYIYEYNTTTHSYENTPLSSSTTFYGSTLDYTYKGLESGKTYYIRAVGDTVDGVVVDTGYIKITVQYTLPSDNYYVMSAVNYPVCGWIEYKTNIRIVEGKFARLLSTESKDGLIDNKGRNFVVPNDFGQKQVSNSKIDCRDGILVYDEGWAVPGDFMLRVNFENLNTLDEYDDYPCIRLIDTEENEVSVFLHKYDDNDNNMIIRFKLVVKNNLKTDKNIINFDEWAKVKVVRGSVRFINNGITLTSTGTDCYTKYTASEFPSGARIPVIEGETITLSWDEKTNTSGNVYIFPNGSTTGMVHVNNKTQKCVSYTATKGVTFVTFRFGVAEAGKSITYKNIAVRDGHYDDNYFLSETGIKKYIIYSNPIETTYIPISGSFSLNRINNLYSITAFNITGGAT